MLIPAEMHSLADFVERGPFVGYAYSYPHKTAYRPLTPPRPLRRVWRDEDVGSLFLYVHIPFCEVRCGFCNLFTFTQPEADVPALYLAALARQARVVREQVPGATFSRAAIGGGTPTYLNTRELESLLTMLRVELGIDGHQIPISLEASPATLDSEKLACLKSFGIDRLSVGIQSFSQKVAGGLGRPQHSDAVAQSLELIAGHRLRILNLDLIYGSELQSLDSWLESVAHALRYTPEEIFLYPLYVRPLTGLAKSHEPERRPRLEYYRAARDVLLSEGYEQCSLRMFRRRDAAELTAAAPAYRCQEDGMIGLGCGARSYTRTLHYADRFAVKQAAILPIIREYIQQDAAEMGLIRHGIELSPAERRRRYVITSLLLACGLDRLQYAAYFGSDVLDDFADEIGQLFDRDFAVVTPGRVQLTPAGLEYADAIGPWLYSTDVRQRMEEFAWNAA